MTELWNLLLEAQESENGIPKKLIDQKKDELKYQKQQLEKDQQ